jgi:copper chaperone CopZ
MTETPEPARDGTDTLETVARWELLLLWSDLNDARRAAIRGSWSMNCDHLVDRIKKFTQQVGPISWEEINIDLLEDGVYQRVHGEIGITVEVDMAKVAETRASIDARMRRLRP